MKTSLWVWVTFVQGTVQGGPRATQAMSTALSCSLTLFGKTLLLKTQHIFFFLFQDTEKSIISPPGNLFLLTSFTVLEGTTQATGWENTDTRSYLALDSAPYHTDLPGKAQ